jgi:hypothetical protein
MPRTLPSLPLDRIGDAILLVRGQRVMLDSTLAGLYGIETRALIQAVNRNLSRFPQDFCFRLTDEEGSALRSQTVMSNPGRGGRRTAPYAFTEQGVAMLSSVLRSPTAVAVNIEIMRTFVQIRRALADSRELADRFAALEHRLESRLDGHDEVIAKILEAIRGLMSTERPARRPIGFVTDEAKSSR